MQKFSNQKRISVLKGMLKVCLLMFVMMLLYQLFMTGNKQQDFRVLSVTNVAIKEHIFSTRQDYMQQALVNGRAVLIIAYSDADKQCLPNNQDDWFVAWAQGRDLSCPLRLIDADKAAQYTGEACRALQDQCRGSYYRLDGTVYDGQLSKEDLLIPNYQLQRQYDQLWLKIQATQ